MKADELREKCLEFFRSKKHKVVASDSLVPKDDPTVLFTPAGMNQFKKQFLGLITDFTRAASSQRCLRTDDLEKVGKTDCHHTFFEMLGNFSFGDYFKKEAIAWAWEFLTRDLAIPAEKLWVSVYQDDDEAFAIWKDEVKFPAEKIVKLGDHDNFWPADAKEKGPNGPCGPCSEIFFDLGPSVGCGKKDCTPACGCGRFIEIWNLVFTQFNRKEGGTLEPLPQKNIDTGMGLERITAVMQGVRSNFETDLFQPIIKEIKSHAKHHDVKDTPILYAIADHLRAVVFSIFDGVLPSNEARGYVIRKLIRKSVLHLRDLGVKEPFLYRLVPVLTEVMRKPYPELVKERETIANVILAEEKNFVSTLDSSPNLFKVKFKEFKDTPDPDKVGEITFQLHDTYGIPAGLTMSFLDSEGIEINKNVFENELSKQKERSKSGSAMQGDVFSVKELHLKGVPQTVFVGYDKLESEANVLTVIKDNKETHEARAGDEVTVVLDQTPFYAEQGGQVGDIGVIAACNGVFEVKDAQKSGKVIVHIGRVKEGVIKKSDACRAQVDRERRLAIMRNHTATHLLQAALRKVLGSHVQQQGSFVADDRLRFDFTHFKGLTRQELDRIEEVVNGFVIENLPVSKKEMSLEEARKEGALAFFAEKYEDTVRVVSVEGVSKEFCGGTHLDATGSIGLFKIVSESSIASGVRRIEAFTGTGAYKAMKQEEEVLAGVAEALKTPQDKIVAELGKRLKQVKDLEKKMSGQKLSTVAASIDSLLKGAVDIKGVKVVCHTIPDADMDVLRKAADLLKQKEARIAVALGSAVLDRVNLIVGTNVKEIDAGALIKAIAPEIGGSGGGRKDFAQAGGTRAEGLEPAFDKFKEVIVQTLK
ncbi:MAG: alanine--tRNA ligase [Candidatus Omnitrophica bacterium]|nr:alanine--tRNA ligase [Candidatus Omnitrophota bacterium]